MLEDLAQVQQARLPLDCTHFHCFRSHYWRAWVEIDAVVLKCISIPLQLKRKQWNRKTLQWIQLATQQRCAAFRSSTIWTGLFRMRWRTILQLLLRWQMRNWLLLSKKLKRKCRINPLVDQLVCRKFQETFLFCCIQVSISRLLRWLFPWHLHHRPAVLRETIEILVRRKKNWIDKKQVQQETTTGFNVVFIAASAAVAEARAIISLGTSSSTIGNTGLKYRPLAHALHVVRSRIVEIFRTFFNKISF